MAKKWNPPHFGVRVLEGLPGSGKSYFAVRHALRIMREERRPVFTNLPLKLKVMKAWLRRRDGAEVAGLLHHLSEKHFRAFLKRQRERFEFVEVAKRERGMNRREYGAAWLEHAGPDVFDGPNANWIPPLACIMVDEAHHWFPMSGQKNETPDLLAYVTMLRHHMHDLWFITQNRMQITINVRRLAREFWFARDMSHDKMAWSIRLGHLGFRGFGYAMFTPDQEVSNSFEDQAAAASLVVMPWLPWHRWVFRLYESFTHVASVRESRATLRRLREEAGLDAEGNTAARERQKGDPVGTLKAIGTAGLVAAGLGLVFVAGMGVGRVASPEAVAVAGPTVAAATEQWWLGVKVTGWTRDAVLIDGKPFKVGADLRGFVLHVVDRRRRVLLGVRGSDVWMWRVGAGDPQRLGTSDEVRALAAKQAAASGRVLGSTVTGAAGPGSQELGP